MRILVCNWRDLAHPASGGAEVYTHSVLTRLAARGHQVTLFCAAVADRPDREVVDGVQIVRAGSRLTVYRDARQWYLRHGRGRFDIVVDEVNTRPFFCHEWVGDVPSVAFIHQTCEEIWFSETPWPAAALGRYWLEPRWLRRYRHVPVLTVSQSSKDSLRRFGIRDVTIVSEGLEVTSPVGQRKEDRPTAVFVGRLVRSKRADHVLAAFEHARQQIPDAQLWMIGSGPMDLSLRRLATEGVTFLGRVSEQEKFERMARAHVLAIASVREGWGLVVAEAAAVGTRAVGYDAPGMRDSIRAAQGLLSPVHPEALGVWLAEGLRRWSVAPAPVVPLGGVAHWDDVTDQFLESLRNVIGIQERKVWNPMTARVG